MVKRRVVQLVDDVDGSAAVSSHVLSLDGVAVRLDLSPGNAGALRAALEPWLAAGRRVDAVSPSRLPSIRDWAAVNGFELVEGAPVPPAVLQTYAAHAARR